MLDKTLVFMVNCHSKVFSIYRGITLTAIKNSRRKNGKRRS